MTSIDDYLASRPPQILWAEAFLSHWRDELKEPCDVEDIMDWAYELYKTHGHLRAQDVAQAMWRECSSE